jgi:ABC-type sugar transport system substrate-binding protein
MQATAGLSFSGFHVLILEHMPFRRFLFTALLLPALSLVTGCKKPGESADPSLGQIILLTANATRPYEIAQVQTLQRLVFSRPGLNFKTLDAAGDPARQSGQLDSSLAEKPLAIFITPVDSDAVSAGVLRAVQSGVMVIGLGEAGAELKASSSMTVDQGQLGQMAGEIATRALIQKCKEEGKAEVTGRVVEIRGDEKDSGSTKRHEAFVAELRKHPGIIIAHDTPGGWTREGGRERAAEALRLQKQFDVLYAHNDSMALGASMALADQRENTLIIGTDGFRGDEGGFSLVNTGDIDASIHQPLLVEMGWKVLLRRLEDPAFLPKPSYRLAPTAITPKSLNDLRINGLPPLPEP